MKKKEHILLALIIICAFTLRLYRINNPVADWHSWRQADTAAVTRNFYKFGFNPIIPRYDDLSNVQSGMDNPEGYRFVEVPIYQSIVYGVSFVASPLGLSIEIWHRLVSIVASLATIYLLYLIGKRFISKNVGLLSALFYAILPFSVYYSRAILPETVLVFFTLLTIYLFDKAIAKSINGQILFLSALSGALALLIKPIAIFFFLPIAFFCYRKRKVLLKSKATLLGYVAVLIAPIILWRLWMSNFPEGIPAWQWLLNNQTFELKSGKFSTLENIRRIIVFIVGYQDGGIRYRPAFFYWIVWKRFIELILGYAGLVVVLFSLIALVKNYLKSRWFIVSLLGSIALYVVVFAGGNVQHDYYQIIAIPYLSILLGYGAEYMLSIFRKYKLQYVGMIGLCIIIAASLWYSWSRIKTYYWINNHAIVEAGKKADELLPLDAKVIASYSGDTAFLYQTNRQGWPVGHEIEKKIQKGATYYVSVTPDDPEALYVMEKYTPIYKEDTFVIVKLEK